MVLRFTINIHYPLQLVLSSLAGEAVCTRAPAHIALTRLRLKGCMKRQVYAGSRRRSIK
jgi:hypothetical protein